jgi:hypothetical protein
MDMKMEFNSSTSAGVGLRSTVLAEEYLHWSNLQMYQLTALQQNH